MLITKVKRKMYKALHPIVGEIWCLHRVVSNRSIFPSNRELEITPQYLEDFILRYKSSGYSFVSLDVFLFSMSNRKFQKQVNISFDDGFEDIYTHAYPIFKKFNIPFTIYLTTGMPDGLADLWWIQLERYCDGNVEKYESILQQCYSSYVNMADEMHRITHSEPDFELCKELSLSWNQIREMVDSGLCTLGTHTRSHPGLTRISRDTLIEEIQGAKQDVLRHFPSIEINHFSYPHSMQDHRIQEMVKICGYKSAVLGYGGCIRYGDNPLLLNRHYIVQK